MFAAPTLPALIIALVVVLAGLPCQGRADTQRPADEALIHSTAVQVAVYGYAAEGMMRRLSAEVLEPATRKAPFNAWYHFTELATPEVSPFRAPNNDTLYSTAWLDLRREPVILSMPDTAGRYYTAHVMDLHTETIANIGQRLYGTGAGRFAIVGPGWNGKLPEGIRAVVRCDTPYAAVLLRLLVDGPADVPAVNALQKRFRIASLSRFLKGGDGASTGPDEDPKPYQPASAADRFARLDALLRETRPKAGEAAIMAQFAGIGIGPADVVQRLVPAPELLEAAWRDAESAIATAGLTSGRVINGWRIQTRGIGRYGYDYLQRASVWHGGPLANVPEESLYPSGLMDADGRMLDGSQSDYLLHFRKDELPPVNAFWSLTIYRMSDGNLVANPLQRYSLGDRSRGLRYGSDGSLSITIAKRSPGAENESNWLPAPDAPFYLVLRTYGPKPRALDGRWVPPAIRRAP